MIIAERKPFAEIQRNARALPENHDPGLRHLRDRVPGRRPGRGGPARLGASHRRPPGRQDPGVHHRHHHPPVRAGNGGPPARAGQARQTRRGHHPGLRRGRELPGRPDRLGPGLPRRQHHLLRRRPSSRGVWAELCAGCGNCITLSDRRHLPHRPLHQVPHERPLRRHAWRQVRDQPRRWTAAGP